jgi:hypothetical protein
MDPNLKLVLDEMAKLRTEMKECFTSQEAAFSKRLNVVAADEELQDICITNLEEAVIVLDISFAKWRLGVDSIHHRHQVGALQAEQLLPPRSEGPRFLFLGRAPL